MSGSERLVAIMVATGYVLLLGTSVPAQGFREQGSWQFRSSAETQVKLNIEGTRLQLNGIGTREVGSGSAVIGLSSGLGVPGNSPATASTTANATSGTTTYNVTVTGDGNDVKVDGYLNLDVAQESAGLKSRIKNR